MDLPRDLLLACRQRRLLILWAFSPLPLLARPPANRPLALNRWAAAALDTPAPALPLPGLPPLPLLSLDPTDSVERAFRAAGVTLHRLRSRRDLPAAGRHNLLKLAGDLPSRSGLPLSRAEIVELRGDPHKRHLLAEARRLTQDGALLLLGCDPAGQDWRAWWALLAPLFAGAGAAMFALGPTGAPWPQGVVCVGPDFQALNAALWAAQPPLEAEPPAVPAPAPATYVINYFGPVYGPVVGDSPCVRQDFGASPRTGQGDWEALVQQVVARLDALAERLDQGVGDLKRGQAALYHQVDVAYRDDLARVLAAVQQGRLEQGEMQRTLDAIRRALRAAMREGLPMDAELRAAIADLTEGVESSLSLERKLELTLPLIPMILAYKIELAVDSRVDLHAVWDELRQRAGIEPPL